VELKLVACPRIIENGKHELWRSCNPEAGTSVEAECSAGKPEPQSELLP
jgi:hypothetical protein